MVIVIEAREIREMGYHQVGKSEEAKMKWMEERTKKNMYLLTFSFPVNKIATIILLLLLLELNRKSFCSHRNILLLLSSSLYLWCMLSYHHHIACFLLSYSVWWWWCAWFFSTVAIVSRWLMFKWLMIDEVLLFYF